MFKFKIIKKSKKTKARIGKIITSRGRIQTPVFMPCATVGAVKGISPAELENLGFEIILANTYHLYLRPSEQIISKFGGLQKFMNWPHPILTDSGGYQVFSLGKNNLAKITGNGVIFRSHLDGSRHQFTPEKVIDLQLALGSDIIMPLDYCPSADAEYNEIERAVDLTNKWFERAWHHYQKRIKNIPPKNRPALFAIIQGGAHKDLREKSYQVQSKFPVDGFAIGGVANAGESKLKQQKALKYTLPLLPVDKPRYLMGVGEPADLIYAIRQGIDMFDCVLPTRLARHGTAWLTSDWHNFSKIELRKACFQNDKKNLMKNCLCPTCQGGFSRGYLSHLAREKEMLGLRLLGLHNLSIIQQLLGKLRGEI